MPAGEFPSVSETVTQETINDYADLSGDYNPIHVDEAAGAASEFGGTIAHGPIALQTYFRSLTEWLGEPAPPAGTVAKITFRAPTRPGDTIHCELRESDGPEITTECVNQDGTVVIGAKTTLP